MTVPLDGGGGYFDLLGHYMGFAKDVNAFRGAAATTNILTAGRLPARYEVFQEDAAASTPVETKQLDGFFATAVTQAGSALGQLLTQVQTLARNVTIDMVNTDSPLGTKSISNAMSVLIAQMVGASESVNASAPAAGAQTAATGVTSVGNPVIVSSVKGGRGNLAEYVLPETIKFVCTNDNVASSGVANSEPFSATGQASAPSTLDSTWPAGSGASTTLNVIDSTLSNQSTANLLQNSDYDTVTNANYADNWVWAVGTPGTDVTVQNSTTYTSTGYAAKITGDGSTLYTLRQTFNTTTSTGANAGGTPAVLAARTSYAVNVFYKLSADPAAGVLRLALVDGSGSVINDDSAVANSTTVSLPGVNDTNWHALSMVIRTPTNLPSTYKIELKITTALSNTVILYLDHMAMAAMKGLYSSSAPTYGGGPQFAIFSGSTKPLIGDSWTVAITNTWGEIQKGMQRIFDMNALGLQIPSDSAAGETVADSVVA